MIVLMFYTPKSLYSWLCSDVMKHLGKQNFDTVSESFWRSVFLTTRNWIIFTFSFFILFLSELKVNYWLVSNHLKEQGTESEVSNHLNVSINVTSKGFSSTTELISSVIHWRALYTLCCLITDVSVMSPSSGSGLCTAVFVRLVRHQLLSGVHVS